MIQVCSFDIFDTCLVRTCGKPVGVFDIMARRVLPLCDEMMLFDFVNIRINGEKRAREDSVHEEITLSEIYDCCDFSDFTSMSKSELMELEQTVESECLVAVSSIQERIQKLREEGNRIIFISDMYLPLEFLRSILFEKSLMKEGDMIFVSSHERATKASGQLFKIAKSAVGSFSKWTHFGDNPHSDVNIPKSLGLKAERIRHSFSSSEKHICGSRYTFDKGVGMMSAYLSRGVRLRFPTGRDYGFAADYVAPLLVPFVYWLLEKADKENIKELFFIARDGKILYEIAKILQKKFPGIALHYIYMSRASLYFPASKSYEEIIKITDRGRNAQEQIRTVKELTGIDISEFASSHDQDVSEVIRLPHVQEKLLKQYQAARENLISYFRQTGLASQDHSSRAIVDLRGTAKSHDLINELFVANGFNQVGAFYLELTATRTHAKKDSARYAALCSERLNDSDKAIAMAYSLLESYYAAADHPRTIGYLQNEDGIISPAYAAPSKAECVNSEIFKTNKEVCCEWASHYISIRAFNENSSFLHTGFALIKSFILAPEYKYLDLLTRIDVSDTGKAPVQFVRKLSIKECITRKQYTGSMSWYEASFVYTFGKYSRIAHYLFAVLFRVNLLMKKLFSR